MKEKLNLRNAILWTVALVLLVVFFASFGFKAKISGPVEGGLYIDFTISNAVWGARTMYGTAEGHWVSYANVKPVASIPGLIGAILILLASGGLVAITFLVKDEKLAKILTLVCGGVILVAGVLFFFVGNVVYRYMQEELREQEHVEVTIEQVKAEFGGGKVYSGQGIGAGIVAILLAAGVVVSQFIKNVQFIKSK